MTTSTVILIDNLLTFDQRFSPIIWLVEIFRTRWIGNQSEHERYNRFSISCTERELGHTQTIVIANSISLVVIVGTRLTQFLINESRAVMSMQLMMIEIIQLIVIATLANISISNFMLLVMPGFRMCFIHMPTLVVIILSNCMPATVLAVDIFKNMLKCQLGGIFPPPIR